MAEFEFGGPAEHAGFFFFFISYADTRWQAEKAFRLQVCRSSNSVSEFIKSQEAKTLAVQRLYFQDWNEQNVTTAWAVNETTTRRRSMQLT